MNSARNELKFKFEIHLPEKYGLASIDVTSLHARVRFEKDGSMWDSPNFVDSQTQIKAGECSTTTLNAGGYVTVTRTVNLAAYPTAPLPFATRPASLKGRVMLNSTRAGQTLDVAPLVSTSEYLPDLPVNPDTTAEADISSVEVDDPRVNKHKDDWKPRNGNSFGLANSVRTVGQPAGGNPKQDADAQSGGNITDFSLFMPPPKGAAGNLAGFVTSTGELGYVHTGLEGSAKAGVPWRTFRLQKSANSNTLPDWALMDLFTVPPEVPAESALQVFAPHGTSVGGRVNLNATIRPFTNSKRINPLAAVFLGVKKADGTTIDLSVARTIADNIRGHNGTLFPKYDASDPGFPTTLYDSPGEVIEIVGVADSGESSEDVVRQVSNQLTARGGVFSVYAIGQSLRQTPDGRLVVLAEQRTQTFLERLQDASGGVKTRMIYNRRLSP